MKHKNSDTDGNRAVRDIKSRPVIIADVKIQKINNLSESDSVDQISDGASEN